MTPGPAGPPAMSGQRPSHGEASCRRGRVAAGLLLLWLVLPSARAAPTAEPEWHTLTRPGVRIRYRAGQAAVADRAAAAAAEAITRAGRELGIAPERAITVVLHPTHRDFGRAVGLGRRELVVGIAAGAHDVAHVDASGAIAGLPRLVAHEVAHLLLSQAVGAGVPRWFDEGYAEHVSGSPEWAARERLAEGSGTRRLFRLAELEQHFPRAGEEAAIAYAQAHSLVAYLLKQSPPEALAHLVRQMRAGKAFPEALVAATGRDAAQWEAAWRRDLHGGSRWQPWILFAAGASGITMALLCLLAFRAMQKRKECLPD